MYGNVIIRGLCDGLGVMVGKGAIVPALPRVLHLPFLTVTHSSLLYLTYAYHWLQCMIVWYGVLNGVDIVYIWLGCGDIGYCSGGLATLTYMPLQFLTLENHKVGFAVIGLMVLVGHGW